MQTLYIDVYFLINFTVDYLALYFACFIIHLHTTTLRLIISSLFGALFACVVVLTDPHPVIYAIILILTGIIICMIAPKTISISVIIKLLVSFLLFETLFGGIVTMLFSFLDERLSPILSGVTIGAENSRLLLILCIILIAYGILKLAFIILGKKQEAESYTVIIKILDCEFTLNAMLDGGNLLCDPMTGRPVIIVKRQSILKLFESYGENALFDAASPLSSRMRILPTKSIVGEKLLYGIRPDDVKILIKKKLTSVDAVIAIDDTEGSFNSGDALLPSSLIL